MKSFFPNGSLLVLVFFVLSHPLIAKSNDFIKSFAQEWLHEDKQTPLLESSEGEVLSTKPPLAEPKGPIPPHCNPHEFQSYILGNYENPQWYASQVKRYFNACSSYFRKGQTRGILGLLEFAMTDYDIAKNNSVKLKTLNLSDGSKIKAYIGIKNAKTPRPWVILKCGVFCDITDSKSSLNFLISYFDQSPFNVIFVSNHTGTEHIKANRSLMIAGFYEVYDYYEIAHWLKYESPYRETVDSIHAVGISLGGSAALAVSHLSPFYQHEDNQPLFQSATALCSVVNLGPTLVDMYSETRKGRIFTKMTWAALKEVEKDLPEAKNYLGQKERPPAGRFPTMLSDISLTYGYPWDLHAPPRRQAPLINSLSDYWNWNAFGQSQQALQVPTFALASHDDHIVNFNLNTQSLLEGSKQKSEPERGAVGLEFGDHCGFSSAYGFAPLGSVLQTFIIANSPQFASQRKVHSLKLPRRLTSQWGNELNLKYWWEAHKEKDYLTLHAETFNPLLSWLCLTKDPFASASLCRKHRTFKVPIKFLADYGPTVPQNETEAAILSRQLNGLLRLTFNGEPIDGTLLPPNEINWANYSHSLGFGL